MVVAQKNQNLFTPYMFAMMLLDSRMDRSQFRNHKKVRCGTLLYTILNELLEVNVQCPQSLLGPKDRDYEVQPPKNF